VDRRTRIRLLERAAAELLESETNGSLVVGASGRELEPLVITALGCSVLVVLGCRASVLVAMTSLGGRGTPGPRALASGCERVLRVVHGLAEDFIPTLAFDNPANAKGFIERPR
jgi:hypothetical protein